MLPSESVRDIALMTAVFPVSVSVSGELTATVWAGVFIHGLPPDLIQMAVPPACTANVRAELFDLSSWLLDDGIPAINA